MISEMADQVLNRAGEDGVIRVLRRWQGRTIAFMGDSITASPTGYVEIIRCLARRFPDLDVNIINAGVGAETVVNGLARVDRDLIAHSPDLAFINFGINGAVRQGPGPDDVWVPTPKFEATYRGLIRAITSGPGATNVVPMTTARVEHFDRDAVPRSESHWRRANELIRSISRELGLFCIDILAEFDSAPAGVELNQPDGVHLSPEGEVFMTVAFFRRYLPA